MGNSEDGKASSTEKVSSPMAQDQNNVHVYPDWAAMQAFYGPRMAVPPYMNSAVASPHTPLPYMWGPPQSMMTPYGTPYAAFYPHGGVYAHPGIPLVMQAGTPLSVDATAKSPGNTDGGFVKKLKEFDGLAMSIGNGNAESAEGEAEHRQSDSEATEGSSDGSNRVTTVAADDLKKRKIKRSLSRGDSKGRKEGSLVPVVGGEGGSEKIIDAIPLKMMENTNTALELKDHSLSLKSSPSNGPQQSLPNEPWLPDERELKRERRKQSNRESARRSRLRKQAETEELAGKVQALTAENLSLTAEINKLMESSKKLKLQNVALTEKLRAAQVGQMADMNSQNATNDDDPSLKPIGTANLLARVNNNDSGDRKTDESDTYSGNNRPGAKLHQLLDANPRADTVAAS
ncbi:common plant regulatory factor 1-like isoform X3 [Andrographis paniculata]|uniref:common plant regulatory factor 1-like isoform X3 n=1 Tax=Andrographis paniculata TaxID=175694 RepID=UPI0021E833E1|nr:common plant regulatory factor 1-like isoform X3 [Andrographis paniculata]